MSCFFSERERERERESLWNYSFKGSVSMPRLTNLSRNPCRYHSVKEKRSEVSWRRKTDACEGITESLTAKPITKHFGIFTHWHIRHASCCSLILVFVRFFILSLLLIVIWWLFSSSLLWSLFQGTWPGTVFGWCAENLSKKLTNCLNSIFSSFIVSSWLRYLTCLVVKSKCFSSQLQQLFRFYHRPRDALVVDDGGTERTIKEQIGARDVFQPCVPTNHLGECARLHVFQLLIMKEKKKKRWLSFLPVRLHLHWGEIFVTLFWLSSISVNIIVLC